MSAIISWFSIPADTVDHPTTAACGEWQVSADADFVAETGMAYNSTKPTHLRYYKMLCSVYLHHFYKVANKGAASNSNQGASTSYQSEAPYFSAKQMEHARDMVLADARGKVSFYDGQTGELTGS